MKLKLFLVLHQLKTLFFYSSGSNDHTTKFWTRHRPGDPLNDKYSTGVKSSTVTFHSNVNENEKDLSIPGMGAHYSNPNPNPNLNTTQSIIFFFFSKSEFFFKKKKKLMSPKIQMFFHFLDKCLSKPFFFFSFSFSFCFIFILLKALWFSNECKCWEYILQCTFKPSFYKPIFKYPF